MTTSSSSSQIHTTTLEVQPPQPTTEPTAAPAEGPPGSTAVTEALQFDTIPIELLREHFTRWLLETIDYTRFPERSAPPPAESVATPPAPPLGAPPAALVAKPPAAPATAPPTAPPAPPFVASPSASPAAPVLDRQGEPPPTPRPQYVRMGDKSVWLTKPMLRARGWTESAIRDHLPGPEALKPNPRFAISGAPMPVWRPATVALAESDPKWQAWLERSLQRRQTTLAALADSPDLEFRTRLELADQAIRDSLAPPTLLEVFDTARP
ncbi:hypothetical protein AB0A73_10165 [Glycomyces sp. NPDC047369]